ncbi:MAG: glutamate-cysteine ligase family protein [Candidatus Lokiarchaeota archaeon]
MWFHTQTKENVKDPCESFEVLCGIEEEFLIIKEDGTLIEAADEIMETAAKILNSNHNLLDSLRIKIRSLDAEPNPAQIEYVTLPLPPKDIENAVIEGRNLLITAANELGVKILAQSLHPIQSDPHPITGTHINVSVQRKGNIMKPKHLKIVYNYLWNTLPEIIALSANSPLYQGKLTGIMSNRYNKSTVLKPNGPAKIEIPEEKPALVPMQYYGRMRYRLKIGSGKDEFSQSVIANSRGTRLVDISPRGPSTNIGEDKDESPSRNRVELRVIDVQQNYQDVLDLAYLCCCSSLHAIYLDKIGKFELGNFHDRNVHNAVKDGNQAFFYRNGQEETAKYYVTKWIQEAKKYEDYLDIKIQNLLDKKLNAKPIQGDLSVEFQTKELERRRQEGKNFAVIRLGNSRIVQDQEGTKYKVSGGAQIQGILSVDYKLTYEEKDGMVIKFNGINVTNSLDVQGLKIPLQNGDEMLRLISRSEYLTNRLFGGF